MAILRAMSETPVLVKQIFAAINSKLFSLKVKITWIMFYFLLKTNSIIVVSLSRLYAKRETLIKKLIKSISHHYKGPRHVDLRQ